MSDNTAPAVGPVRIEMCVSWPTGHEVEIAECPRDKWEAMTPAEREAWCDAEAEGFATNRVNWGYAVLGDDEKGLG